MRQRFIMPGSELEKIIAARARAWGKPRTFVPGMAWHEKKRRLRVALQRYELIFLTRYGMAPTGEQLYQVARFLEAAVARPPRRPDEPPNG